MYLRIEQDLRNKIATGRFKPGSMLPGRRDLAAEYGVDRSTIQRALAPMISDGTLVTDGTRGTFVRQTISATTAQPSPASTITTPQTERIASTTKIIGIIAQARPINANPSLYGDPWFSRIINGLERHLSARGNSTRFASFGPDPGAFSRIEDAVAKLLNDSVDAIVLIDIHGADRSEMVHELSTQFNIPIVYVSPQQARCPVPHVYYDQESAGFFAADHLIAQGCRDIVFVAPVRTAWSDARVVGAQTACKVGNRATFEAFRYTDRPHVKLKPEDEHAIGHEAALTLLSRPMAPSAIIAENDNIAYGILAAVRERGLIIGIDIRVVGFDDQPDSRSQGLSSMHPPLELMGDEAGRLVLQLDRREASGLAIRTASHLVQRESSGK
jgi:DNA-binding LacI/PurR family transcriptional regulator